MTVTKTVALSKVQTLAVEYLFKDLERAKQMYMAAESTAKDRFGYVLAEIDVDPAYAGTANFENRPDGATISYEAPEPVIELPAIEAPSEQS